MSKNAIGVGAALALALAAAVPGPASAHHSYAMFDPSVTMTIPATVVSWDWTNPHSFLQVIADANGKHWALETASPSMLIRNGATRLMFKPGDKVTVKMHPRRDNTDNGSLLSVTFPDGREVKFEAARPAGPPASGPPA
jgi:hypothetical protein